MRSTMAPEQQSRAWSVGERAGLLEHPLTVFFDVDAVDGSEQRLLQGLADLVTDPGPAAVQEATQGIQGGIGAHGPAYAQVGRSNTRRQSEAPHRRCLCGASGWLVG